MKIIEFHPNLYHKAIILIATPLIFGTILAIVFLGLQQFYEEKIREETRNQEIIHRATIFHGDCSGIISSKIASRVFLDDRGFWHERDQKADMERDYKILQRLTVGAERLLMERMFDRSRTVLQEAEAFISDPGPGHPSLERVQSLQTNLEAVKAVMPPLDEFSLAFANFRNQDKFTSGESAQEVSEMNSVINKTLLASLAISLLLTLLLYSYFMRTIYSGVRNLMQNAQKFQNGEPLNPLLAGSDEIALVDGAFHKMVEDLQEASRFKQQMLSMVSHDLRTPLTAVTGYLSLVSEGPFSRDASADVKQKAAFHEANLFNVIKLINSVLDSEKIEAGAMELAKRSIYVETIVEKAIEELQDSMQEKHVSVAFTPSESEVEVDPHRIGQAAHAFLETAIQSTEPGKQVNIELRQIESTIKFQFVIPKSIAEESLLTLFERYSDSRPTDIHVPEDQSLALAAAIVKLHGGEVGTAREEAETKLWFSLPLPS